MAATGSFIGRYRILTELSRTNISTIYVGEDTAATDHHIATIITWPDLPLSPGQEQEAFQQATTAGSLQLDGHTFPIIASGFASGSPFIVTPYNQATLPQLTNLIKAFDETLLATAVRSPGDIQALIASYLSQLSAGPRQKVTQVLPPLPFDQEATRATSIQDEPTLTAFVPPPPPPPGQEMTWAATAIPPQAAPVVERPAANRRKRLKQLILALAALVLLLGGGTLLFIFLPASAATVTLTPRSKRFSQTYNISLVTGKPGPQQALGRMISYTTPTQSQTANATGQGHHDATPATGTVILSQINYSNGSANGDVGASTITGASGVQITIDSFTAPQGGSVTVNAQAVNPGAGGNIPADDLDGPVAIVDALTQAQLGTAYLTNPQGFSGGTDASDYVYVQQTDIDSISTPLVTQLTSSAQAQAQQQVHPGDLFAQPISCTPTTTSNHNANDAATSVTVSVSVKCTGETYSEQDVKNAAIAAHKLDAASTYGNGYVLDGDVSSNDGTLYPPNASGNFTVRMATTGTWVFKFSAKLKKDFARHIAGQTQANAVAWLSAHSGLTKVDIATSGIGTALPSAPEAIQFKVATVPGLRATSKG